MVVGELKCIKLEALMLKSDASEGGKMFLKFKEISLSTLNIVRRGLGGT
jgi:hypothetical protein